MKHRFRILKRIPASLPSVMANYLDMEHVPVHSGLRDCEITSETDLSACFVLTSDVGPFRVRNVHYFEFRPPNRVFQMVKTPLGPMRVLATATARNVGPEDVCTEVIVDGEIDLPRAIYPFRRFVERILRHLNKVVLDEDLTVLLRREKLYGPYVEDYLRSGQRILFKEAFRKHYSQRGPAAPPADA